MSGKKQADPDPTPPTRMTPTPRTAAGVLQHGVGIVHFEDADGHDNGAAHYHVHPSLRERVLVWRHKQHEQSYVNEFGEWVYRQTATSGIGALAHDEQLEPLD